MTEEYVEGIKQYHDMRTWMILAGGLQIFIGIFFFFSGIMSLLGVLIQSVTQSGSSSLEMAMAGMVFYFLLSACVIFLGIGTIMCRKWARALGTAGWGLATVWGIIGMVNFFLIISEIPKMMPPQTAVGGPPIQKIMTVVMLATGIVVAIFSIGVPTLFFFFYKNRHVRMTCENIDRQKRWTDDVPLPVLPIILIFASFLFSISIMPFYNFTLPFFGTFLQGWEGAGVFVFSIALAIFLAKSLYRLKTYSWYLVLGSGIIGAISVLLTFLKADFAKLYSQMGYPEDQIDLMLKMDLRPSIISTMSLTLIVFIIYMFWIRKYFTVKKGEENKYL